MFRLSARRFALIATIAFLTPFAARAADLRIGLASDVSSLDPHYLNIAPNIALASHLFDALIHVDANGQLVPGLATAWRAVDPVTWELQLRRGVRFHDGSELTADDVLFSLARPALLTGSPGPFTSYTKQIVSRQAIDRYTVRLTTAAPYGPLPLDLSSIFIVSRRAAENAKTDDFNSGKALIGTGPFRFGAFRRGDAVELIRNDEYWGVKSAWQHVTLRIMTSAAPRVAALLAGDVDAIESVPPADLARLENDRHFRVEKRTSWRTLFWVLNQTVRVPHFITDNSGRPLAVNPLRDARVRRAISMAINRQALAQHTLEGLAVPASNIVAPGIVGYNDALAVASYDPAGARRLLAEAGYPEGFMLTLHGPNNRYINDERIAQTVAQFLSRIGIRTRIQTLPLSVYFGKARSGAFDMALLGWGTLAGDFGLRTLVGTSDPKIGWGTWNWGRYSNPQVDELVRAALGSVDQQRRNAFAQQAAGVALQDNAVIPLHHQVATWAMRKGLAYSARIDEFTFAQQFRPE